jgi:paraquat-inducible protein B
MSFTDKDKRILIEVINHIHNAYASDEAFKDSESSSITLPARLLSLSAEVIGHSYRPAILNGLEKLEIELLLTSLFRSIDAMKTSLQTVITALPGEMPDWARHQFEQQVDTIAGLNLKLLPPMSPQSDDLVGQAEPADLVKRHHELVEAQEALSQVDLDKLRDEVSQLEAMVGPRQREVEELQSAVSRKTAELEKLTSALSEVEKVLQSNDVKAKERFDQLLNVAGELISALNPYLPRTESRVREAVETVAEKVSAGKQLKAELLARINEVSEVLEETARISAVLSLYTEANHRVVRSVPTVINVTKEKLSRVEEQLREIDADLKQALVQHQSARHVAEVARI